MMKIVGFLQQEFDMVSIMASQNCFWQVGHMF